MDDNRLENFGLYAYLLNEGLAYLINLPIVIFYVWANFGFSEVQLSIFSKSVTLAILMSIILTYLFKPSLYKFDEFL